MTQLAIGNWKLNGSRQMIAGELTKIAEAGLDKNVGVCVPFPYLDMARLQTEGCQIQIGSQDVSRFGVGAYTGEVSARMVADVGGVFTLIGHSERRSYFSESGDILKDKVEQAVAAGLYVIFCVGGDMTVRQSRGAVEHVLDELACLREFKKECFAVAYEPAWAIGTGLTASADEIRAMHLAVKEYIGQSVPVLYGGSVKAANAAEILAIEGVDGVLVGGASLKADEFIAIGRCARVS